MNISEKLKTYYFEIVIAVLLVVMYKDYIPVWISGWSDFDSFYAFGFFLLAFLAYMFKKNYEKLKAIPHKPSYLGIVLLLIGFSLYIVGIRSSIDYLTSLSLPIFLSGIILTIYGVKLFLITLIPIILFAFSLPIFPLHRITMPLQLLSARAASDLINFLGVPSSNEGNIVNIGNYSISVVAGCSGLKSLSSLFFMSVIYSYFINATFWRKILFVFISLPLAFLMNVFRITVVGFYAFYNGYNGLNDFHEWLGIIFFIISIFIIILISRSIETEPKEGTI